MEWLKNKKLMTPGPVPLPARVREIFAQWECHHRAEEFGEVLFRVFQNLKKVFQTNGHCYLLSSTGTGALEAGLVNCLSSEDKLFSINAGKFGQRWANIAKACGIKHRELKTPWGKDINLNKVEDELRTGSFKACAFQSCETSTGALLPTRQIVEICRRYHVLSIVDGMTALGAVDLPMDQWEIDVLIGGSQKAFMLPTGLAFISLSEKAEQIFSDRPRYYFDLKTEKKANLEGRTRYSTPIQFVLALDWVLDQIINSVGLKRHFERIVKRAKIFREQVELDLFPRTPSPSLTCLSLPGDTDDEEVKKFLLDGGYVIVGGQDQLKGKVLRIGHMGDMNHEDLIGVAGLINNFFKLPQTTGVDPL